MKRKRNTLIIVTLLILATNVFALLPLTEDGKSPFVDVVKNIRESVVNIQVEAEISYNNQQLPFNDDFFKYFFSPMPENRKSVSMGTGFIFKQDNKDIFIITNNHVVENGEDGTITVTLADKAKYEAEIVGLDPMTDLAVIKIHVPDHDDINISKLGNSDNLEIGDWAIAIGNPFGQLGLDRTVTVGVISATGRSNLNFGSDSPIYQDYIQTDAAINPGNSGGPLLNIKGEVIGVNAAITSPAGGNVGIGFAIPVNIAKKVVNDLMDKGKVERAYLGILPQEMTDELRKSMKMEKVFGVIVAKVEEDTPADKAGLEKGDVIVGFNSKEIPNVSKFRLIVANSDVGSKVPIDIIRKGKYETLYAKLEAFPTDEKGKPTSSKEKTEDLGMEVEDVNSDIAKRLGVKEKSGVVISVFDSDSPAKKAGLSVGDIIQEINYNQIENVKDYKEVIKKILKNHKKGEAEVMLFYVVTKSGSFRYVPVTIE